METGLQRPPNPRVAPTQPSESRPQVPLTAAQAANVLQSLHAIFFRKPERHELLQRDPMGAAQAFVKFAREGLQPKEPKQARPPGNHGGPGPRPDPGPYPDVSRSHQRSPTAGSSGGDRAAALSRGRQYDNQAVEPRSSSKKPRPDIARGMSSADSHGGARPVQPGAAQAPQGGFSNQFDWPPPESRGRESKPCAPAQTITQELPPPPPRPPPIKMASAPASPARPSVGHPSAAAITLAPRPQPPAERTPHTSSRSAPTEYEGCAPTQASQPLEPHELLIMSEDDGVFSEVDDQELLPLPGELPNEDEGKALKGVK